MNKIIVSFCIATFQRCEVVKELVEEILSIQTDKLEIVVCDNNSADDTVKELKKISDVRLKIYVNERNVGSLLNMYEALEKGTGEYLFYINDRDNVDKFKIRTLINILEYFETQNVAFARCVADFPGLEKFHILKKGKNSLSAFASRMDHPTGFIFKRDVWCKIRNRKLLFQEDEYGDYPMNHICSIMARQYKGALVYGDICDLNRKRIDFTKVKSRYYENRKDKRLFYTPEVLFRELLIGQKILKNIKVEKDIREEILVKIYTEHLSWCVTGYESITLEPLYTAHYDVYLPQDFLHVSFTAIMNGIKLWKNTTQLCLKEGRDLCQSINSITKKEFVRFIMNIFKSDSTNILTYKQEEVLKVYERWMYLLLNKKTISEYLLNNYFVNIAIYGMGRIGKHLFNEFEKSNICVKYVIDQNMSKYKKYYNNVPVYNIDFEFPWVDLIIVTVPSEAKNIIDELRKKSKCYIKSINDILFIIN